MSKNTKPEIRFTMDENFAETVDIMLKEKHIDKPRDLFMLLIYNEVERCSEVKKKCGKNTT
jgi:hypothetical protein